MLKRVLISLFCFLFSAALCASQTKPRDAEDPNVLAYLRACKGKAVLLALNMSSARQEIAFDLASKGFGTFAFGTRFSAK